MKRNAKLSLILAAAALTAIPTVALAGPTKAPAVNKKVPAVGTIKGDYVWDGDEWDYRWDDDD